MGTPEAFEEHLKLMFDLLTLAYQSETTRVSTLMFACPAAAARRYLAER